MLPLPLLLLSSPLFFASFLLLLFFEKSCLIFCEIEDFRSLAVSIPPLRFLDDLRAAATFAELNAHRGTTTLDELSSCLFDDGGSEAHLCRSNFEISSRSS